MHNDKLQMISHPSGRESQALLPSPGGRESQALLPSPSGRGAGGEGTTLATNRTQPEPSPQPSLGDFRWSSPKGRGSQDSATPAFRPRWS